MGNFHLNSVAAMNPQRGATPEHADQASQTRGKPKVDTTPPSASAAVTSLHSSSGKRISKRSKPYDAVSRFLTEIGLSEDLADVVKGVGIIDEARMEALGRLPESALDRFENSLAGAGLDVAARLLIVEGLKQRAAAASAKGS